MTKQNPQTLKESTDLIIQGIQAKQLREKTLNGEIIQTYDVKGELDSIPRNFARKLDKPCDELSKEKEV